MELKIDKTIHYCWFGGGKKTKLIKKCMKSWKKYCPDYKIIEWNESNFDINCCKYVNDAYNAKKWAFVSDYARLWIIYNYGGIYLDTDVELIKPLENLLTDAAYFAFEDLNYVNTGLGFGAQKGNRVVKMMLDDYNHINFYKSNGEINYVANTFWNTNSIKFLFENLDTSRVIRLSDCTLYPAEYFNPKVFGSDDINITDNTYSIHHYSLSWAQFGIKDKIKISIKKIVGKKFYNYCKKIKNKFLKKL